MDLTRSVLLRWKIASRWIPYFMQLGVQACIVASVSPLKYETECFFIFPSFAYIVRAQANRWTVKYLFARPAAPAVTKRRWQIIYIHEDSSTYIPRRVRVDGGRGSGTTPRPRRSTVTLALLENVHSDVLEHVTGVIGPVQPGRIQVGGEVFAVRVWLECRARGLLRRLRPHVSFTPEWEELPGRAELAVHPSYQGLVLVDEPLDGLSGIINK